jgi:hypothetical protein
VSNFNYALTIVLNPATNSSFVDNYYAFLLAVANAAQTDTSSLVVLSVEYGSVNL